jgi:fumarate hydratase class II
MAESKKVKPRYLMSNIRKEMESVGEVEVAADVLRGAQTQRSLEYSSIGKDLMSREMFTAYAASNFAQSKSISPAPG